MSQIAGFVGIIALLLVLGNKAIEIDVRCELRHVLPEIIVSVDFKNLDLHLLNVFNINPDLYLFIQATLTFVVVTDLDVRGMLELLSN